jgi:hypothetical protein
MWVLCTLTADWQSSPACHPALATGAWPMTATLASSIANVALQLHVAALHGRLFVTEIDSIATALLGGFVDVAGATAWASDAGFDITTASSAAA